MTLRIVITAAATTGIGRAMAEAFMARGDQVHICDISAENLDKARAELPGLGITLADVSDPDQVNLLFAQAQTTLGGLDVLINNAGIAGPTGPIEDLDLQDWHATLAVTLDGTFLCSQHARAAAQGGWWRLYHQYIIQRRPARLSAALTLCHRQMGCDRLDQDSGHGTRHLRHSRQRHLSRRGQRVTHGIASSPPKSRVVACLNQRCAHVTLAIFLCALLWMPRTSPTWLYFSVLRQAPRSAAKP